MNPRRVVHAACVFAVSLMFCTSVVPAGLFRAYVASTGSDANPCNLPQPCRLLPAALAAVADGGEIWMLDSANFNTAEVNITKSVSILAVPGALGSVVATGGGDGIRIDAASVKITLRNLVIVRLGNGFNGIKFVQGAELNVSECEIANMQANGIVANAPGSKVSVKNTVLRGNGAAGFLAYGTVVASLDGVHSKGNSEGVYAAAPGVEVVRVTVSNSVLSGNGYGALAESMVGGVRLVVEGSVVTGNSLGIVALSTSASAAADVTASHNTVTHNSDSGIYAYQEPGSVVVVVADGNTVTENGIGFQFNATGIPTIYTRGNNTLKFNTNDVTGGTLTALAGQ